MLEVVVGEDATFALLGAIDGAGEGDGRALDSPRQRLAIVRLDDEVQMVAEQLARRAVTVAAAQRFGPGAAARGGPGFAARSRPGGNWRRPGARRAGRRRRSGR